MRTRFALLALLLLVACEHPTEPKGLPCHRLVQVIDGVTFVTYWSPFPGQRCIEVPP